MDMAVWYFFSDNAYFDIITSELIYHGFHDFLDDIHTVVEEVARKLSESFYLLFGNQERVSLYYWMNIEKCNTQIVFIDLVTRNFTCDDTREN
jgi:hypothetical protein